MASKANLSPFADTARIFIMRMTLDIAEDVLRAAEHVAQREQKSVGEVISDLARCALANGESVGQSEFARAVRDLPGLPQGEAPSVTLKAVNSLRDVET
jgi:hypothetical protein